MNIGEAARESGVSERMIRHYEKLEMVPAPLRRSSGYREYGDSDVHRLRFIANARSVGFALEEIADQLRLWSEPALDNAAVSAAALACTRELDAKFEQIGRLRLALLALASGADTGIRPEHPAMPRT